LKLTCRDLLSNFAFNVILRRYTVDEKMKPPLAEMCVNMHSSVRDLTERYLLEARRHFYVTPTSYLELISSYKDLLSKKQKEAGTYTRSLQSST